MMEKARRLLSVMVTEAQTSLWSLRERDLQETGSQPANQGDMMSLSVIKTRHYFSVRLDGPPAPPPPSQTGTAVRLAAPL